MTEYVFRRQTIQNGDTIDIPDNARDIDFQHKESYTIVCYFEKEGQSVL